MTSRNNMKCYINSEWNPYLHDICGLFLKIIQFLHIAGSWELVSWSPHGNSDNIRCLPHLFDDSINSDLVASVTYMSKQIYTDIMSRRNIFHQAPDQLDR